MALQGTIDSFPVVDVLGLLSGSAKTGCLELVGDRGRGSLWLAEGRIVAGEVEGHPTADATDVVFEFLLFESGSFEFLGDAEPPEMNLDAAVADSVAGAESMLAQWQEVREAVPDTAMAVRLVGGSGAEEIVLTRSEWEMVAAVADSASVSELIGTLGLGEFEGCLRISALLERGLIALQEPAREAPEAVAEVEVIRDAQAAEAVGGSAVDAFPADAPLSALYPEQGASPQEAVAQMDAVGVSELLDDDPTPVPGHGDDATSRRAEPAGGFPEHFPIDDLVGSQEPVSFDAAPGLRTVTGPPAFSAPTSQSDHDAIAADPGTPHAGDGGPSEQHVADPHHDPVPEHSGPGVSADADDDVLSQIGRLSPKAAEAIAAALGDGESG